MNYYRIDTISSKNFKQCSANGPGIRLIVWCQGCSILCEGCHNSEIWPFEGGKVFGREETEFVLKELEKNIYSGITFLGGEPMADQNVDGFIELAKAIKEKFGTKKTLWGYSGYTYDILLKKSKQRELLELLDVLVDGPFILKQRNISLKFRGSENQRLINVQESLKENKIILYDR